MPSETLVQTAFLTDRRSTIFISVSSSFCSAALWHNVCAICCAGEQCIDKCRIGIRSASGILLWSLTLPTSASRRAMHRRPADVRRRGVPIKTNGKYGCGDHQEMSMISTPLPFKWSRIKLRTNAAGVCLPSSKARDFFFSGMQSPVGSGSGVGLLACVRWFRHGAACRVVYPGVVYVCRLYLVYRRYYWGFVCRVGFGYFGCASFLSIRLVMQRRGFRLWPWFAVS